MIPCANSKTAGTIACVLTEGRPRSKSSATSGPAPAAHGRETLFSVSLASEVSVSPDDRAARYQATLCASR